ATKPGWYFVELKENPDIELVVHRHPHVGMLLFEWSPNEYNRFSPWRRATASTEEGIERENVNLSTAVKTEPDQEVFDASQVANEHDRPYRSPNLWASAATRFEEPEWIAATWNGDVEIETVALMFNTDLDTDLRSLWMRHGMRAMHETIKDYRLVGIRGQERVVLAEVSNNVQRFAVHRIGPVALNELQLEVLNTHGSPHAQVYGFHAFGPGDGPNQRSAG
ncbi:MAG: hypothetical protein QGH20_11650, partial [Candidatus Latescibacteria bacterium]|nr:hypothetical protein [Candidatus Latescibacterota bacterium]